MLKRTLILGLVLTWMLAACGNPAPTAVATTPVLATATIPPATTIPVTLTEEASSSPVEFVWSLTGEPNPISVPSDLATDAQGNLYVLDAGNDRIQVFDPEGHFIRMWGASGSGEGGFNFSRGDGNLIGALSLDPQGNIYVADNANQRIQKFDPQAKFLMEWGGKGTSNGQFLSPVGITLDGQGNIYVIDDSRDEVQKFDKTGKFLLKWGSHGSGDGQFNFTGQLEVSPEGNIYVADFANHRIQKFDSQGTFLAKWGAPGKAPGQFNDPGGIAIDAQGRVYVTEYAAHPPENYRVQIFDSDGNFLSTWGHPGNNDGEFLHPLAIAVDKQGNIYVSDETNRIQKFRLTKK